MTVAFTTETDWAPIDPVNVACDKVNGELGAKIAPQKEAEEILTEVASTKFHKVLPESYVLTVIPDIEISTAQVTVMITEEFTGLVTSIIVAEVRVAASIVKILIGKFAIICKVFADCSTLPVFIVCE